jgi:exosortase/archaeosortase family protein
MLSNLEKHFILEFLASFSIIFLLLYSSLAEYLTRLETKFASILNPGCKVLSDNSLYCGEQRVYFVDWKCSGIVSISLYSALIIAYPGERISKKIQKLLVGSLALLAINFLRIALVPRIPWIHEAFWFLEAFLIVGLFLAL